MKTREKGLDEESRYDDANCDCGIFSCCGRGVAHSSKIRCHKYNYQIYYPNCYWIDCFMVCGNWRCDKTKGKPEEIKMRKGIKTDEKATRQYA